jgi:hypothetical protein
VSFAGLPLGEASPAFDDLVEALTALIGDRTLPPTPIPAPRADPPVVQPTQPPHREEPPPAKPRMTTTSVGWAIAATAVAVVAVAMYGFLGKSPAASSDVSGAGPSVPAEPRRVEPPPKAVPADPPAAKTSPSPSAPSEEAIREFVGKFLDAAASGDSQRLVPFYADRVDYYAMGPVGLDVILEDKRAYFRRWPQVTLQLDGGVSVEAAAAPNAKRVRFTVDYRVASDARHASATGSTATTLTIALIDGALKVVDQKEVVKATPR